MPNAAVSCPATCFFILMLADYIIYTYKGKVFLPMKHVSVFAFILQTSPPFSETRQDLKSAARSPALSAT